MSDLMTDVLVSEYETIVDELPADASDRQVVAALVSDGDWTEQGARAVLALAQTYGVAILRNALALAAALNVEDGDSGL